MIVWEDESVTLFRSLLYETTSAVIQSDEAVLVVDPNWLPHEVEEIRRYVYASLKNRKLVLLFTHSDYDHIIGYGAFPGAKVIASRAFAELSPEAKMEKVDMCRAFDDQFYLQRDYRLEFPPVDYAVEKDGESLEIGGLRLVFYTSPGHTDDGIMIVVEPLGVLLAGDYLSDLEFPFIYTSSKSYEATMEKVDTILDQHTIEMLVPGHGGYTLSQEEIKQRQEHALAYIHSMREAILEGDTDKIDRLIEDCRFPLGMKDSHESNRKLMENELASERSAG
ncbi:MBL fold metallo-hydrolase [Gorillibacterium massiliense]|uniref:MBL fold metallo-hydrolase n=1 Tax=Gorillibacterium massiliense TaxID=1280390 RepID=UPI0004BBD34D|nr:MBL fold metallo-hydrolase [Gorillibacterium massiliense]